MPTISKSDLEAAFGIVHPVFPGTPQYVWPLLSQRLEVKFLTEGGDNDDDA